MPKPNRDGWTWFDALVGVLICLLLYFGVQKAVRAEGIQYLLTAEQRGNLYALAYGRAGIGVPEESPRFYPVTRSTLAHMVCNAEHCGAIAAQLGDSIFYLHTLDPANPHHMGVLVHELVHYVQWSRDGIAKTCEERMARERVAYRVQAEVLDMINVRMPAPDIPRCL